MIRRLLLLLALLIVSGHALAFGARDVLWEIVSTCAAQTTADYCATCRFPRADAQCGQPNVCTKSTEVWAMNENFVAIRDIKMCGCRPGFVHGLVLPRAPVRGVEDTARPDGIWSFAWQIAMEHLPGSPIALVVNPPRLRSQDQLHVHVVKLRAGLDELIRQNTVGEVTDLAEVWKLAASGARSRGLSDYGVLVTRSGAATFSVVVSANSPETIFTEWKCR